MQGRLPHIHVRYQGYIASVSIDGAVLLAGELPPRQLRMVQVWAELHQEELLEDWDLCQIKQLPKPIVPLK